MPAWPLLGRGHRHRRRDAAAEAEAAADAEGAGGPAASSSSSSSSSPPSPPPPPSAQLGALLHPSLGDFIATSPGVAWLADELGGRVHVPALPSLRAPTVRELNGAVLQAYKQLLSTDAGQRLASAAHARERAAEDVLQVPLYIVEDFVRQRLRSTLARNWGRYAVILCSRATAATAAVRLLKAGGLWLLRRYAPEGRARRCAELALHLLVPTELYGALAAVGLLVARLHHELSEIQPLPAADEDEPAAAAAEYEKGAGAGRR
jgi:hypothetical protein